jgi:excisionase family DNA binding protein
MRRCPTCNRNYTDEALLFCLNDGATLVDTSAKQALSIREARSQFGVSWGRLIIGVATGKLKIRRIGRDWRVKRADLEAYMRKR